MNKWLYSLLVLLTTGLMGSSFAVGKMGLNYASPLMLVALRFSIAGVLMAIAVKSFKRIHPTQAVNWLKISVIGLFQTAGVMGCIFLSLRTITAGESSILTFMNPLLVVLFGTIFLKAKYVVLQWIGVLTGFIGVFITMGMSMNLQSGTLLGLGAALCWSIATLLIKVWGAEFDHWVVTAYQMLFGGIALFGLSFIVEKPFFVITVESISILLWLAIMASIVQFAGWFTLLKIGDPGKTSAFLFLAPFFGVLTGWLLLGEVLGVDVLIGGLFILIGIFLVNWNPSRIKEIQSKERLHQM